MTRKTIGIMIFVSAIGFFFFSWIHNPQLKNMKAIDEWRETVQPQIDEFKQTNNFDFKVGTGTRNDGTVLIVIEEHSEEEVKAILEFLNSLSPPRPFDPLYETIQAEQNKSQRASL